MQLLITVPRFLNESIENYQIYSLVINEPHCQIPIVNFKGSSLIEIGGRQPADVSQMLLVHFPFSSVGAREMFHDSTILCTRSKLYIRRNPSVTTLDLARRIVYHRIDSLPSSSSVATTAVLPPV